LKSEFPHPYYPNFLVLIPRGTPRSPPSVSPAQGKTWRARWAETAELALRAVPPRLGANVGHTCAKSAKSAINKVSVPHTPSRVRPVFCAFRIYSSFGIASGVHHVLQLFTGLEVMDVLCRHFQRCTVFGFRPTRDWRWRVRKLIWSDLSTSVDFFVFEFVHRTPKCSRRSRPSRSKSGRNGAERARARRFLARRSEILPASTVPALG
jgi:hypothetical protein